jgi:hypothetical protein
VTKGDKSHILAGNRILTPTVWKSDPNQ